LIVKSPLRLIFPKVNLFTKWVSFIVNNFYAKSIFIFLEIYHGVNNYNKCSYDIYGQLYLAMFKFDYFNTGH